MSADTPTGILYNTCYGGFGLSADCIREYEERTNTKLPRYASIVLRKDPVLIQLFLEKGSAWMSGKCAQIDFFEAPQELVPYLHVSEYDGLETPTIDIQDALVQYLDAFLTSVEKDRATLEREYEKLKESVTTIRAINKKVKWVTK